MASWTPFEWATFLSAAGAFVIGIINALKGKTLDNKLDQHLAVQAQQHNETLDAIDQKATLP